MKFERLIPSCFSKACGPGGDMTLMAHSATYRAPSFMSSPLGTPHALILDVETLGQGVDAAIGTIGAVVVNVLTGEERGSFYTRVDLTLNQPGRVRDEGTLSFWANQKGVNPKAWAEMFDPSLPRGTLLRALESLGEFVRVMGEACGGLEIVGNGPEFDNAIIEHASQQLGNGSLWQFRRNQSMRTAVWLGRLLLGVDPKYDLEFEGVQHHALDDARHEAKVLVSVIGSLAVAITPSSKER